MLRRCLLMIFVTPLLACTIARAQEEPPPPPPPDRGGPADRGRRGGPPPVPPEQRLQDQIHQYLRVDDAEWQALQPKIDHIQTLIRERERFTKPRPPRPPPRGDEPPPPPDRGPAPVNDGLIVDTNPGPRDEPLSTVNGRLAVAYKRLAVLASQGPVDTALYISALADYRDARAASDAELAQARSALRELLTNRQEIILIVTGILD